jgi:hypothetical protein
VIRTACPAQLAPLRCIEVAHRECRRWPNVEVMLVGRRYPRCQVFCAPETLAHHVAVEERNCAANPTGFATLWLHGLGRAHR